VGFNEAKLLEANSTFFIVGLSENKNFMISHTPMGNPIEPDLPKFEAKKVPHFGLIQEEDILNEKEDNRQMKKNRIQTWLVGRESDL